MLISDFAEDQDRWRNGAPIYVKTQDHGVITFYVRRYGTPESEKALKEIKQALFGPFHREQEHDAALVSAHWLAEYGVSSWENLIDHSSCKTIQYTKQAARELFLDKSYYYSLNQMLISDAINFEVYLFEQVDEVAENIKKP